jgi:hypothetical protein
MRVPDVQTDQGVAALNLVGTQRKIDDIRAVLNTANGGPMDFVGVPVIYVGSRAGFDTGRSVVAFTPRLANVQVVADKLVFASQFGPRNAADEDSFEAATSTVLPNAIFADDWDLYHRLDGEVHCSSVTKRSCPGLDWWANQP